MIEHCASPWSIPLVVVRRPIKKIRLCLDSLISRILGRSRDTKYSSTIDLSDVFWQVPLTVDSRPKTAFVVEI